MKERKRVKYTKEQKQKALKKLTRRYAEWNIITKNDEQTRWQRENELHRAAWKVIVKFGLRNEYFLATNDARGKR